LRATRVGHQVLWILQTHHLLHRVSQLGQLVDSAPDEHLRVIRLRLHVLLIRLSYHLPHKCLRRHLLLRGGRSHLHLRCRIVQVLLVLLDYIIEGRGSLLGEQLLLEHTLERSLYARIKRIELLDHRLQILSNVWLDKVNICLLVVVALVQTGQASHNLSLRLQLIEGAR